MSSVLIVVNAPGLQERRAAQLQARARRHEVEILVAPVPAQVVRRARHVDLVYVIDAGKAGFAAFLSARVARTGCVVEIGDPQARLYRSQGRSAASVALGFCIDRVVASCADGVVVRGRALAEESRIHGPWMHLPDGVSLDSFAPQDGTALRRRLGVPDDTLLAGVVGSITWSPARGWCYGMELVEALAHLPDGVHALVVGDGTGVEHLRGRAQELGVGDRLHLVGRVAHDAVPAHIAAMDVCVSTQTDDPVGRGRTTAKVPEYLACDRFVLATRVGEAARILPDEMLVPYQGAFDPEYPVALAARLRALMPRLGALRGGAGTRALAAQRFDYGALTQAWEGFVDVVAGRRSGGR